MKIDLHCHSMFSQDSSSDPEECIVRAIEAGLDGIAFTEHDFYEKSEPVEKLREKYAGKIMVFRGVEYPSAEGHVLVFGMKDDRFHNGFFAPLHEILRTVKDRKGVAVIPHPYRGWLSLQADVSALQDIEAIEAFNGRNTPGENNDALQMAAQMGLPTTGGSDAHEPSEVGRCYTEFFDALNYDNFLSRLREGRYRGVDARSNS